MDLKFVSEKRPDKPNVAVSRRQKLVRGIDQQIGHVRKMIEGESPRAAWPWMDDAGTWFLPIRYGRQPIELKKGMFAIQCPDLDHAEAALCTIRALVLQGEFDGQLAAASTEIRSRFAKPS